MDVMVQQAQHWVNTTYATVGGYVACAEDGITGWSTMYSLTRALQHELGISALSDTFGPTTMSYMVAFGPVSQATTNLNMRIIIESALFCKGYPGGLEDGGFGAFTQGGLVSWKTDMGFTATGTNNTVSAKEMKTLLTMDAYVLLAGGDAQVRDVQRWLNATYISRQDFTIVPCDGFFSRDVQRGLLLGIQYSLGMADGVANGTFGPGTQSGLRSSGSLTTGNTDSGTVRFVQLFKAALIFNGQGGVDWGGTTFTATTASVTETFQSFCRLPVNGSADYQTWCSLLVSTGDVSRIGKACDCATPLDAARAASIKAAGYETVGRYITNIPSKMLLASEVQIIFDAGLNFFPIYQEYNNLLSYFTEAQGTIQGQRAIDCALNLSLPTGSIIYFSVDFDATGDEIRSYIVPFFRKIQEAVEGVGNKYLVGVYGSRNVCSMVSAAGYAVSSFVGGMSTGFSGNLGFPLPPNWAFDQIKTLTLASGKPGVIEIDNDIKSDRDLGISNLTTPIDQNAAFFTWVRWIEARAGEWAQNHPDQTAQRLTASYLRTFSDASEYTGAPFDQVFGFVDEEFVAYCNSTTGRPAPGTLRDPKNGVFCDIQHFGASLSAMLINSLNSSPSGVSVADFGGWAGDLITATADCYNAGGNDAYADAYSYAYQAIGWEGSFGDKDMVADVDAMVTGLALLQGTRANISDALAMCYSSSAASVAKYQKFITARFGNAATLKAASHEVFNQLSDVAFGTLRGGLWLEKTNVPILISTAAHGEIFSGVCDAMTDVVLNKYAT